MWRNCDRLAKVSRFSFILTQNWPLTNTRSHGVLLVPGKILTPKKIRMESLMEKNELLGNTVLYGGASVTSCSAPAAYATESTMLLIFSAIGALSAICGLIYTIWNGNRNFRLQQQALELNMSVRELRAMKESA